MKVGFLGLGSWGFCLAKLLSKKGFSVTGWSTNPELVQSLKQGKEHPYLKGQTLPADMKITLDLNEAIEQADCIVEAVTSAGLRNVFEQVKFFNKSPCPVVVTSKGIEQNSGLILPAVALEVLGESFLNHIGFLSGPSFAQEVAKGLPTSVVGSGFRSETSKFVCDLFTTLTFRVYPNNDINGVAYGGALKNIIAIACGICEGLGFGFSSRAALMTRGLHEIRKLAEAQGCKKETIYGLSGMGDLCLTCSSMMSRNYRFGYLLAQGKTPEMAHREIEMVVEGSYTCVSTLQLSQKLNIPMPITETVYKIIYKNLNPKDAVRLLMERAIKEEHL
ncbi:Glycerol-3-phosphate dehydrogenase [NAD(P)+] [Candidatus Rubidus massiliensis]|nr:Glycerol-3-phosphate dehydrogenase [NAD(P)+] [Candidatus Rubidus massiliensis]